MHIVSDMYCASFYGIRWCVSRLPVVSLGCVLRATGNPASSPLLEINLSPFDYFSLLFVYSVIMFFDGNDNFLRKSYNIFSTTFLMWSSTK